MSGEENSGYQKLRKGVLATMIVVPAIPFILVLTIGYHYFTGALKDKSVSTMVRLVEDHSLAIQTFLDERRHDLAFLTDAYRFDQLTRPEMLKEVLANLRAKSPAFVDLGVFNRQGVQTAYRGPFELAGRDYAKAEWFLEVKKRGYYISNVFLGYRQVPHFVIAVVKRAGDSFWVVRATIDPTQFSSLVEKIRIGDTGEAFIVNKAGVLQTQRRSGGVLLERDHSVDRHLAFHRGINSFTAATATGDEFLWATAWLNDGNWLLVVRQAEADAFQALAAVARLVVAVTILGGVLIVGLALYTTGRIIGRMEKVDREKDLLGRQLIVAGRLAEIGEMSAGIAHEINNPLQIINAEQKLASTILDEMLVRGDIAPSEELVDVVDSIKQISVQVDRCGAITHALLKFARQDEPIVVDVNLAELIPDAVALTANKAKIGGVTVTRQLADEPLIVRGDYGQLQQVLVNLLNNALDAIEETDLAGRITVAARSDSGRIIVSVADNGGGISPADMEKIFTPFFTTKPVGQGTGLGLSICFGLIEQMGGRMEVSSRKGEGSTMTINLPAAPGDRS